MMMEEKFTSRTWPEEPERVTLEGRNKFIGFWLFLGGETIMFASLFATYLALKNRGSSITAEELFNLPLVFAMTILLLTSSLTSVYAIYHMKNFHFQKMQAWFAITLLLGFGFLCLELYEFYHNVHHYGFGWTHSAFSSAYYMLVGTHGAHVLFGLCWITALILRNAKRGLSLYTAPKYYIASLYWHFIDVVWVFIFTVVYLMGKVG
jgi:Cytochrome c oxidase subunit III.